MEKIAILYICTGKYSVFWDGFYTSTQANLFKNCHIEYFVFTDQKIKKLDKNVHLIYQEKMGWPNDTLLRYHLFSKIKTSLEKFDYIFFMNANLIVEKEITEDLLPLKEQLLGVIHPGFFDKEPHHFTYERNPLSTAYISHNEGQYYFMGGFNGGKASAFLKLIEVLTRNIQNDLDRNIIAIWHDESHINRYFINNRDLLKVVGPEFGYPEGWSIPFDRKITILDKTKFGGHSFLREEAETPETIGNKTSKKTEKEPSNFLRRIFNRFSKKSN